MSALSNAKESQASGAEALKQNWLWHLLVGIAMVILGFFCIGTPFIASLAIAVLLGWILVVGGVVQLVHAFKAKSWKDLGISVLSAALYLGIGVWMLTHEAMALATLTLLLAAFFIAEGVIKAIWALRMRELPNWGWMLFSGLVSFVLGVIIWSGMPWSAIWAIGLLLGIDLVFAGSTMIMVSLTARKLQ